MKPIAILGIENTIYERVQYFNWFILVYMEYRKWPSEETEW